jgi:hypothetical protein
MYVGQVVGIRRLVSIAARQGSTIHDKTPQNGQKTTSAAGGALGAHVGITALLGVSPPFDLQFSALLGTIHGDVILGHSEAHPTAVPEPSRKLAGCAADKGAT